MRTSLFCILLGATCTSQGQLGEEHRFIYPSGGRALAIRDVDGDGDGDFLRETGGHLMLHTQVGPEAFRMEADLGLAGTVHCIRFADVNGDGEQDVLFADQAGDRIGAAFGLGAGSFAPVNDLVVGMNDPYRVEAADLDGDGDLDLVHSSGDLTSIIAWSENQGGGSFVGNTTLSSGFFGSSYSTEFESRFAIGDIDQDGDVDLALRNPQLAWLENDGDGNFTEHPITGTGFDLAVGDLDGDTDPDLLLILNGGLSRILNNGNGSFASEEVLSSGAEPALYDLKLMDVEGDGDLDAFFQTNGLVSDPNRIHGVLNDGTGHFTATYSWPEFYSDILRHYAIGHLDGDPLVDGTTHMNDGIRAWFSADNHLVRITSLAPVSINPVDVNDDGAMDVVVSNYAPWSPMDEGPWPWGLATHMNSGGGEMLQEPRAPFPEALSTRGSVAADVDGDGDQDLAVLWQEPTVGTSHKWQLLINNAGMLDTSSFLSMELAGVGIPAPLEFADVDGDGDADAVCMSGSSRVMLNNGNGAFTTLGTYWVSGTGYFPMCFALMDMDNDGDRDQVWGHGGLDGGGPDSLFWNANDGTGAVGPAQFACLAPLSVIPPLDGHFEYRLLRHPDLDLDGIEDLVLFNHDSIGVLHGTGAGTFTDGYALPAPEAKALAIGDLNGDQFPDLIAIASNGDILFWPNIGGSTFGAMSIVADATTQSGTDDIALADMDNDGDLDVLTCSESGAAAWLGNSGDLPTAWSPSSPDALLAIYPNPMRSSARMDLPWPLNADARIELVDASGRLLRTMNGNGSSTVIIERGHLESGLYVLHVVREGTRRGAARIVVD